MNWFEYTGCYLKYASITKSMVKKTWGIDFICGFPGLLSYSYIPWQKISIHDGSGTMHFFQNHNQTSIMLFKPSRPEFLEFFSLQIQPPLCGFGEKSGSPRPPQSKTNTVIWFFLKPDRSQFNSYCLVSITNQPMCFFCLFRLEWTNASDDCNCSALFSKNLNNKSEQDFFELL